MKFIKATEILKNKEAYIGNIVGMNIRGAGSQWTKLVDVKAKGDKIEFTVKMLTHNAHMGIKTKTMASDKSINYQDLGDWLNWCKMYNIETNHE